MTGISFAHLEWFLNTFPVKIGRTADYGGTDRIGADLIKKALKKHGIDDYVMLDYDSGFDLMKPIRGKKFDLGICMDLLEHVENPFLAAENISASLKKGAFLFVTAPQIWEPHDHPKDYWRFLPDGMMALFKKLHKRQVFTVRDQYHTENVPRQRVVGVFEK